MEQEFDDDPEMVKRIIANIDWKKIRQDAFDAMGHIIEAHRGWIVKTYPDGRREKLHKIK